MEGAVWSKHARFDDVGRGVPGDAFSIRGIYLETNQPRFARNLFPFASPEQASLWTDGILPSHCSNYELFRQVNPDSLYEQNAKMQFKAIFILTSEDMFFCFPLRAWKPRSALCKYADRLYFCYIACTPADVTTSGKFFVTLGYSHTDPGYVHELVD